MSPLGRIILGQVLWGEIAGPNLALVDAVTALRASELVALKWKNVGWDTGILRSEFAFVEGELKDTKSRNNALPLARPVLNVLRLWREHTPYRSDEDWIFASPHYHGKTPYTYQILFRRHIRPVIERVSTLKSSKQEPIGWHTLRRSLATLLISNGENVKVAQSQLRHTTPKITLELYAQAFSADQQKAHRKAVQMMLPAKFPEKLKARSAAPTGVETVLGVRGYSNSTLPKSSKYFEILVSAAGLEPATHALKGHCSTN